MIAETSSGMQISEARRLNLLKNTKKDRKGTQDARETHRKGISVSLKPLDRTDSRTLPWCSRH